MAITSELVTCISCIVILLICAGPMALIVMWLLQDDVASLLVAVLSTFVILVTCLIFSSLTNKPRFPMHQRTSVVHDIMGSPPPCTIQMKHRPNDQPPSYEEVVTAPPSYHQLSNISSLAQHMLSGSSHRSTSSLYHQVSVNCDNTPPRTHTARVGSSFYLQMPSSCRILSKSSCIDYNSSDFEINEPRAQEKPRVQTSKPPSGTSTLKDGMCSFRCDQKYSLKSSISNNTLCGASAVYSESECSIPYLDLENKTEESTPSLPYLDYDTARAPSPPAAFVTLSSTSHPLLFHQNSGENYRDHNSLSPELGVHEAPIGIRSFYVDDDQVNYQTVPQRQPLLSVHKTTTRSHHNSTGSL